MDALTGYASDASDNSGRSEPSSPTLLSTAVVAAPTIKDIAYDTKSIGSRFVDASAKELKTNPTVTELWSHVQGPQHPIRSERAFVPGQSNSITGGTVRPDGIDEWAFAQQFYSYDVSGLANDPSGSSFYVGHGAGGGHYAALGDRAPGAKEALNRETRKRLHHDTHNEETNDMNDTSVESKAIEPPTSRRRRRRSAIDEPIADIGHVSQGPWAPEPEPEEDVQSDLQRGDLTDAQIEYRQKKGLDVPQEALDRQKQRQKNQKGTATAISDKTETSSRGMSAEQTRTIFHGKDMADYQGRSWIEPPKGLHADDGDHRTFLPHKCTFTYKGHTKAVQCIQFFPKYGHLLLSGGLDGKIKIWDVYNQHKCKRTYLGHTAGVRQVIFDKDGRRFLSCSFDQRVKLWDTETGKCLADFPQNAVPYCAAFHPKEPNTVLIGLGNRRIMQYDVETGEMVQEYDHHTAPVNSITFVENGDRFISTSDDKKILIWDFGIPVPIKYISDPTMHSVPVVKLHPNQKYIAGQSLDNTIVTYAAQNKFHLNSKKRFTGHVNAGFACQLNFSPNGQYVISGDSDGRLFIWDWKTCSVQRTLKAHSQVCIGCEWHPLEPSIVATCGWDGTIKLWR